MKKILFIALFLVCFTNAFSAVKTWDAGGADANWQTAANWVGDVLPVMNDDLVFPANAAQFSVINNVLIGPGYKSLTIEGGNYSIGGSSNATVGFSNFGQTGDLSIPSAFVP